MAEETRSVFEHPVTFILYTSRGDMILHDIPWEGNSVTAVFDIPVDTYVNGWVTAHPDGSELTRKDGLVDECFAGDTYTIVLGAFDPVPETVGRPTVSGKDVGAPEQLGMWDGFGFDGREL
jgi:hypothetical protein